MIFFYHALVHSIFLVHVHYKNFKCIECKYHAQHYCLYQPLNKMEIFVKISSNLILAIKIYLTIMP